MDTHISSTARTLALASLGGLVGSVAGLPAGWLLGAIGATLAASLAGFRLHYPSELQSLVLVLVGISIGSSLSPRFISEAASWLPSLAGLMVAMLTITFAVSYTLARLTKLSGNTSFLSAYPGHMVLILQTASQYPCNVPQVTMIQSIRLLFLVVLFPLLAQGAVGERVHQVQGTHYMALALLVLAAGLGAAICQRCRLPAAALLGAILGAALVSLSGFEVGSLPTGLKVTIFILTGAMIGTRFTDSSLGRMAKLLPVSCFSVALTLLATSAIAFPISVAADIPFTQLLLAYAPGGAEVMALIALAVGHDAGFVGIHHLARLMFMAFSFPLLLRLMISKSSD
ncbi:AbrB family transcriptional regulator [Billgrantia ethanolica]|uniref:AbrB family transcriptional regulator n=1 Tax=Billgrantia ethanolica TaxID=2733486 RepID=A0ABS9A1K1_9GAMM|nr:AbrB family transcriptional regulator [Halomonas ethanolica]MCE8002183.1 AbrB family transcriptional regulator [Halomonas ethanolica]